MPSLEPTPDRLRLAAAALFLFLSAGAGLPALAQITDAEAGEAAATDEETEAEAAATIGEQIFVRDSLPFAPRSNTIATKLPVDVAWTPAHVGVVDLARMDEQGANVLGDALHNVSGMNVQTGSGVFDFFVVRGFDSLSSGLILTDGAPEPEVTFYQLYNAERVEVLKGPGGFLYGPNPLAGTVNIVRKQPVPSRFGVVGASVGSFGTSEATVDWNTAGADGSAAFRVNGLYRRTDGWRDGREGEVTAINPTFSWRPNDTTSVHVNLEATASDYIPDAGLPLVGNQLLDALDRDTSHASPNDRSNQDLLRFQVDVEHAFSDRFSVRNKLYSRQLDWLSQGTLINGAVPPGVPGFPPGGLVFRTEIELDDAQSFWGNQLEATLEAETGAVSHRILTGVEVGVARDEYMLDVFGLQPIALFDPVEPPAPGARFRLIPTSRGDSETTTIAPYVVDQMRFNEHWQLLVGARYDSIDFKDAATGTRRDDGQFSPMLGVVFAPVGDTAIYANFGRSFAPPSVRVVGERQPEESRQVELGLRQTLAGGRVSGSLAVYDIERTNIAIPDDNGFTQQAGDQRSRGVELEVTAQPAPGWSTAFSYAYTDSELTRFSELLFVQILPDPTPVPRVFDRSGNRSAFAPEHLASLWVSRKLGQRFTLGVGGRWVDDQFIAEDNAAKIDGYGLLNASLTYTWNDWRWTAHFDNLTDQEYETRGFGSTSVIPGRPLSASLGLEYRF